MFSTFDLLASFDDPEVLQIGLSLVAKYDQAGVFHPVRCYFSGLIREKAEGFDAALPYYRRVADGEAFPEQFVKYNALMKLGKYFLKKEPALAKKYLEQLIRNKEMTGVQDGQYGEAKTLLSKNSK